FYIVTAATCQGGSYNFNGQILNAAGTYVDTFTSAFDCDSIVVLELAVPNEAFPILTAAICQGGSYNFNGQILNAAGIYVDTFTSAFDCDSIVVLDLAINPAVYDRLTAAICQGGSYNFNGQILNAAGAYVDTFTSARH